LRPSSNRLPTSERFTTSGHAITALETLPRPDTRLDAVHIVIMGCGRVGSMLARSLEKRGHTVAVIDLEPDSFRRLGPDFSGKTVKGVGFDREVLLEAGITDADGFAAVSSGDNSNILSARVVRETFAVDNVVARIYDPGRAEVYERLGIPTVATVRWTSDQMLRRLLPAGSEPQWRDPSGSVRLMEVHVDRSWVGRTIEQIEAATGARVPFLFRLGAGMVPKSSTVFQDGDLVYAAVADAQLAEVEATLGQPPRGD
jgi:trk system potassium uptake protein TrkA